MMRGAAVAAMTTTATMTKTATDDCDDKRDDGTFLRATGFAMPVQTTS